MNSRTRSLRLMAVFVVWGLLQVLGVDSASGTPITLQVKIQPIQVCNDAGTFCSTTKFFEPETDKIWAQAGIDIFFLPLVQFNETDFLSVGDLGELIDLVNDPGHGQYPGNFVVNMWFVDDILINSPNTDYAVNLLGDIVVADETFDFNEGIGRLDTLAHELGHSLSLDHGSAGADDKNLMRAGSDRIIPIALTDITPDGAKLDVLTADQIKDAKNSILSMAIPEPGTFFLLGGGLLGFGIFRRKRR